MPGPDHHLPVVPSGNAVLVAVAQSGHKVRTSSSLFPHHLHFIIVANAGGNNVAPLRKISWF